MQLARRLAKSSKTWATVVLATMTRLPNGVDVERRQGKGLTSAYIVSVGTGAVSFNVDNGGQVRDYVR